MNWVVLAADKEKPQPVINTAIKYWVPQNVWTFLNWLSVLITK